MSKSFYTFLKENQKDDLIFRKIATKIALDVLKYVSKEQFDNIIYLSKISNVPAAQNIILIPMENENKLGNTLFQYNSGNIVIEIRIEKNLINNKTMFIKTLVHELIHALDMKRIPKNSLIQMAGRSKMGYTDIITYVNDPLEMNGFYQELIFELELENKLQQFKNAQDFVKYAFDKFPDFFKKHLSNSNKQRIQKRLSQYFSEFLNEQ